MRVVLGALSCALLVLACSGDELLLPAEGEPAALAIVDGDVQTGPVGGQLAEPLVVRVTDTRGRPVAGAEVAFSPGAGSVNPEVANTDAEGLAATQWSLGMQTGEQQLIARVTNASPPLNVRFTATASAGAARGLIIVSGNGQSAPAGTTLPAPVVVRLLDGSGNPIGGGAVSWVIGQGGGQVDPATSTTSADGTAAASWTLGPTLGPNTLSAVVSGVGTVPFTATGTAGAAARLFLNGGNNQTATVQTRLGTPLSVRAVDANNNGVGGVTVTWAVTAGGGSLSTTSTTTGGDGVAQVTWTLGPSVGTQSVTATAAGLQGSPVPFTATATAGTASRLAIITQPSSSAQSGQVFPQQPVLQLQDAAGNPVAVPGVQVTARIESGGGTLGGGPAITDASGRATFTNLSITGAPGPRTLTFEASGYASATSSAIEIVPPPPSGSQSTVTANPTSFEAGRGSSTITVTVRDAQGSPLSGIPVQIAVSGTGNTVNQPAAATGADGVATGSFTSTTAETKTVSANAGGVQIQQTATVTVEPPPAPTADPSQSTATVPNGIAGSATVITVQARTTTGAAMTTGGDAVTVTVSGDNPVGSLTVTDNGNGTYTASYTPQNAGTDQVAITLNGVPIADSPYTSTVVAASPSQIGFLTQPGGNQRSGRALRPPIEVGVQDRFENPVPSSSAAITVAIGQGDERAELSGTLTRAAVNGIATFDDLAIDREGEYTLRASSPGLTSAESDAFRVRR